jgi:hypothetical protein
MTDFSTVIMALVPDEAKGRACICPECAGAIALKLKVNFFLGRQDKPEEKIRTPRL